MPSGGIVGLEARSEMAGLEARREKDVVAGLSVLAAVFLTGMKLVTGLLSGSLGILSEAVHSGLDLVAALITLFAVRAAARPADREHPYGHGKIENLSALFETFLLLITCGWIIHEAIQRLFFKSIHVEATLWTFVVVIVSILVDISRSQALSRAAKKHRSQALEADALHFSTDIWSSAVVLLGLVLVRVADATGVAWLAHADAVAALGVGVIVVRVSVRLGRRAAEDLVDTVSPALRDQVMEAIRVEGVREVRQVRLRRSGAELFVDAAVTADRDTSFEEAHRIAALAEAAVRSMHPQADVVVKIGPAPLCDDTGVEPVLTERPAILAGWQEDRLVRALNISPTSCEHSPSGLAAGS
jgi:cation diffusion facilitator family transporter